VVERRAFGLGFDLPEAMRRWYRRMQGLHSMVGLLLLILLAAAGVSIAYFFSPAWAVRERVRQALSPFEGLDAEVKSLRRWLESTADLVFSQYVQAVQAERLKRISLDELRQYAAGMRLQALRDIGIRSIADLQGWSEDRVSRVRGVGPKSATAIVRAVEMITSQVRAAPVRHPVVPFSADTERRLIEALYRQRWFDKHVSAQGEAFGEMLSPRQRGRDAIVAATTFYSWLWKFGANGAIRRGLDQAGMLISALTEENFRRVAESLRTSLNDCRAVFTSRVPVESIIRDFSENKGFYDAHLNGRLGREGNDATSPQAPNRAVSEASAPPGAFPVDSRLEVPGAPPQPIRAARDPSVPLGTQSQQSEDLVSIGVGPNGERRPTEFVLPPAPASAGSTELRWLMRGEPIEIQGHTLSHGLIYVGQGIGCQRHYAIDPFLPARPADSKLTGATTFYFSFLALRPEQRSCYLEWLAEGAVSPTDPCFGMLYFYGLEHRMLDLMEGRVSGSSPCELEDVLREVHRLGDLFRDKPGSVTQCCLRLSDYAAARAVDGGSVPELPKTWARTDEFPFVMRYGIGCFLRDGRPIPAAWALRWAYTEPAIYQRNPVTRCPEEFEAAFASLYREKFGDGLVVPANKTKLRLAYQPGWPVHPEPEIRHEFPGIPDVAALSAPQQALRALVEETTAAIDGYSRLLGRSPAKAGTLEALLNLPLRYWPPSKMDRWRAFVSEVVEPIQPLTFESLLRRLGYVGDPSLVKIAEIVANLGRALVGFEPDILAGARRPKPSEPVVVFPLTVESGSDRATPEYRRASLLVGLSACVALADGHASEDEWGAIELMVASWQHLHVDLRTRLRAQYRLQVRQGVSLASLRSRFVDLTSETRVQMAWALASLAAVDGNVAVGEVKLLEQVYRALGLEPRLLYSHLHAGGRPVPEAPPQARSGPVGTPAWTLDSARLAALRKETDQVAALLAEVFAEEEPPGSSSAQLRSEFPPTETDSSSDLLPSLDAHHKRFLAEVLRKPSWARSELEATAARMRIMLDGAIERINEAAFDVAGGPVMEGDDPIYVRQVNLENTE
jgi:uncharacterized tellurite resistance protein B-like protein